MKNDDIPWPLVKELAFKLSDGAIRANSENVEYFIFRNDRLYVSPVKEVFRRVINIGPDIFSMIIEKEANNSPDKFNYKKTEIDADTCRKIMLILFQSFCKANPRIMVWWNGYKGAHELFKSLFNYGLDHLRALLDAYEPSASDIVFTKHKILRDSLVHGKIPDLGSLNISSGSTSYSFGGLTIEDLSGALRFLGIPIASHHRLDKGHYIPTESASTFHNLKKVQFLPDNSRRNIKTTLTNIDEICLSKGAHTSSAEEVLDYLLDICIQGLLQGDSNLLNNLRGALHNEDAWLICRNVIPETSQSQKQNRFVMRIKGCHHNTDGKFKSIIDFKPRGYPQTNRELKSSSIKTIPKFTIKKPHSPV